MRRGKEEQHNIDETDSTQETRTKKEQGDVDINVETYVLCECQFG